MKRDLGARGGEPFERRLTLLLKSGIRVDPGDETEAKIARDVHEPTALPYADLEHLRWLVALDDACR